MSDNTAIPWRSGQPNNHGNGEHCAALLSGLDNALYDRSCDNNYKVLCQYPTGNFQVWSEWVEGYCSSTCGKGTIRFRRTCLQGTCVGESTKTEDCEEIVCPGKSIYSSYL